MSSGLGAQELQNVSSTLQSNELGNSGDLERLWAIKAGEHSEIYFNLICSVDPSCLQLSPVDDEIYTKFRHTFPDMRVDVLDEKEMKSKLNKLVWHDFIEDFKGRVEDHNFGTLIRLDCSKEYTEENASFCVRTQFLAIEIARNREHHNDRLRFTQDQKDSNENRES